MTDLYFIRHGQSDANLAEIFAGATNSTLTEIGKKQALATASYFDNIKPDMVYASPLARAYDTGLAVSERFGISITADDRLKEINGGLWEGIPFLDITKYYASEFNVWMTDPGNAVCTQGESIKDMQKRVSEAVFEIAKENDGKKVVIATHATPIRVMECIFKNVDITEMKNIPWVTNASVTHVRYDNGKWEIVSRSFDGHLKGMVTALPASI